MLKSTFSFKNSVIVHFFNNGSVKTLEEGLYEEAHCPDHTHKHKDPEEETVDHHGHILPIFNDLQILNQIIIFEDYAFINEK